jgi:hypothetical protein
MTLGASRSRAMTSAVHSITSKVFSVVKPCFQSARGPSCATKTWCDLTHMERAKPGSHVGTCAPCVASRAVLLRYLLQHQRQNAGFKDADPHGAYRVPCCALLACAGSPLRAGVQGTEAGATRIGICGVGELWRHVRPWRHVHTSLDPVNVARAGRALAQSAAAGAALALAACIVGTAQSPCTAQ